MSGEGRGNKRSYEWRYRPGRELVLMVNGLDVLCYHFAADRCKPYFHPVRTSDGILLTAFEPWDHVWHRALWFAWKYLNGVNFWEEAEGGCSEGQTELIGSEVVRFEESGATVGTTLRYYLPGGVSILMEQREIAIEVPRPDGSYLVDWRQTFTAVVETVTLDRTPINEETPWGGYAGLAWRAARSMGKFRAMDSEGRSDWEIEHQRARWVDLSGLSDGGWQQAAGLAMFDHPGNPRHPTHWRCVIDPGFGYINPTFLLAAPYTLRRGESLTLLTRVLVHDGWGERAVLEEEYQKFATLPHSALSDSS